MKLRAFTLLELLVVIAIIGTLSSIVLSSLDTAQNKAADSAVKEELANTRAQAELFYSGDGNSYNHKVAPLNDVCWAGTDLEGTPSINAMVLQAAKDVGISTVSIVVAGGPGIAVCNTSALGNAWAAQVPLKQVAGTYFCVDSTGFASTTYTNALSSGGAVACGT
jgi:prepilin-type N-terminal cleavage/methylation domain-containing protein